MRRLAPGLVVAMGLAGTAHADTVTGYNNGQKIKVKVTDVDGVSVEVHTAKAFRAMAKAARKDGVHLGIRSGFRSLAQQEALYAKFQAGKGNSAAPPGMSNHENGRALDLKLTDKDAYAWLEKHGARYGFRRTVPGEPWHWELVSGDEAKIDSHARPAKSRTSHRATTKSTTTPTPKQIPAPTTTATPTTPTEAELETESER